MYVLIRRISTNHILLMYLTMPFKKNKNLYKSIVFIHYWRAWNILPCYVSKNSYYVCTLTQLWKFVLIIGILLGTFISIEDEIFSVLKNILFIHEECNSYLWVTLISTHNPVGNLLVTCGSIYFNFPNIFYEQLQLALKAFYCPSADKGATALRYVFVFYYL